MDIQYNSYDFPRDISNQANQTNWEFCFLPSPLLEFPARTKGCPTSFSSLISLFLYNAFSAAFNLVLGHDTTRYMIQQITPAFLTRFFPHSTHWQPYAAIFTTVLQIIGMVVATAIARSNGFKASFGALLGLWSLRPRMALLTFIYDAWNRCGSLAHWLKDFLHCMGGFPREHRHERLSQAFSKSGPFRYTLRDTILSECLLNIFSVYFALNFFQELGQDGFDCKSRYTGKKLDWVGNMKSALVWKVIGGIASAFVLAGQFLECIKTRYRRTQREAGGWHSNVNDDEGLGIVVLFTALFITFVNFITSWEIWGSELIPTFIF